MPISLLYKAIIHFSESPHEVALHCKLNMVVAQKARKQLHVNLYILSTATPNCFYVTFYCITCN